MPEEMKGKVMKNMKNSYKAPMSDFKRTLEILKKSEARLTDILGRKTTHLRIIKAPSEQQDA